MFLVFHFNLSQKCPSNSNILFQNQKLNHIHPQNLIVQMFKLQISWTHALQQIVINCYKYHGREDLLPSFNEEEDKSAMQVASNIINTSQSNGSAQVGVIRLHKPDSPPVQSPLDNTQVYTCVLCCVVRICMSFQ